MSPDLLPFRKELLKGKINITTSHVNDRAALNYALPKITAHLDTKGVTEILRIISYSTTEIIFEALICVPQVP